MHSHAVERGTLQLRQQRGLALIHVRQGVARVRNVRASHKLGCHAAAYAKGFPTPQYYFFGQLIQADTMYFGAALGAVSPHGRQPRLRA
jgi:hypothetical protein